MVQAYYIKKNPDDRMNTRLRRFDLDLTQELIKSAEERIRRELTKNVHTIVNNRFDRFREFIERMVKLSLYLVGGALALSITILTIFGITNIGDLKKSAQNWARETVEGAEPIAVGMKRIEEIYSMAVIDRYTIAVLLDKEREFSRLALNKEDAVVLLSSLKKIWENKRTIASYECVAECISWRISNLRYTKAGGNGRRSR